MTNTKKAFLKTIKWFKELLPILFWVIILISMLKESWLFEYMTGYLSNNFKSALLVDLVWSLSVGNIINAYIIAHNFWDLNEYILVISTFLIAWMTVWFIQIPAEIHYLWKKFTIVRNILSFSFSIVGAYLVYFLYNL